MTRQRHSARAELTIENVETGARVLICAVRETVREAHDAVDRDWRLDYGKSEWEAVERRTHWRKES